MEVRREKLVKVEIGPGRYVRMYEKDAIAKGLYNPPQSKQKAPAQNKMITPAENKQKDDFGEIEGVGPATKRALYAAGIYTYDQLADADVSFLPAAGQKAVKKFQEGL